MPKFTTKLLNAEKKKHPLTQQIDPNESDIQALLNALRKRLAMPEKELDLSPISLRRLESGLTYYFKGEINTLSEEDVLSLMRELAAYIGTLLVLHAGGSWDPRNSLWNTQIVFRNIKIDKEGRSYNAPELAYSLGNLASITLDKIDQNIKPDLYKYYQNAHRKRFRETY